MNLVPFESWPDVLAYAKTGQPIYYSAPMDRYPARLMPGGNAPFTYKSQARTLKIWPAGSTGRGRNRTSDPFTADAGHLERFSHPVASETRERVLTGRPREASRRVTVPSRGTRETPRMVREALDFEDQDSVLAEMASALDIDPDELDIVTHTSYESFGTGDVYEIRIKRSRDGKTWTVVENQDQMEALALEIVKQDLEEEPGNFEKSFIEQHINMRRLKDDLESDVRNMAEEDLREMSDRQFWKTAESYIDVPEEDDEGEMPDPDDYIEDVAEKMTEEKLRDPMEYLEEIYGDEAVEKAIEIAGIDVNAAAEDAVNTDGAEHFLSSYDSNSYTTKNGLVYWRDN